MANSLADYAKHVRIVSEMIEKLDLSDSVNCNPSGGIYWFYASKREDVQQLLSLAPAGVHWQKSVSGESIAYSLPDQSITIYASMDGLPPTCAVEEVEEIVPAQPETTRKVRKIVCYEPATPATVEEPATVQQ